MMSDAQTAYALAIVFDIAPATRLLTQTECPSWLYPVTMGATTIWERWDSTLPDGSINPGQMTSFNHYALGAIADWLHRTVAGLAPAEPGYRTLLIQPRPLPGFTHARAEHRTPYGTAAVGWRRDGDTVTVTATVPPNTRARVVLPDEQAYATLLRVLGEQSADAAEEVRAHTTWVPGRTLRERLDHAAGPDATDRLAEAFAELSAGRGH